MKLNKKFILNIVVLLAMVVATPFANAKSKNIKTIPETFTKGSWIKMPTAKLEKKLCNNSVSEIESSDRMVFTFKKNTFSIDYHEDSTNAKILSLTEVSPQKIKGKARFTTSNYEGKTISIENFEFSIKNNRLYSSGFSTEDDPRAYKYGLYHCEK